MAMQLDKTQIDKITRIIDEIQANRVIGTAKAIKVFELWEMENKDRELLKKVIVTKDYMDSDKLYFFRVEPPNYITLQIEDERE